MPTSIGSAIPVQARRHVASPQMWAVEVGTDFWLDPAVNGMITAGNAHELSDYGWTTTALGLTAGSGADFLSSADVGTVNVITFDAANDLLLSPRRFGDYQHGLVAKGLLGYYPTRLCAEVYAAFSTHSANETTTGFGLVTATPLTDTNHVAFIRTDGSNFAMRSSGAADAGAADDAAFHLFRIELTFGTGLAEWFIDGTSQGTIAILGDSFPVAFGASAGTTNRLSLGLVHIWYE